MISNRLRALVILSGCLVSLLLFARIDVAQTTTGALVGTVTDINGARVAGATVSAQAVGSSLKRVTATNSSGEYRIEGLPPADYRVTVSATTAFPIRRDQRKYQFRYDV